MCELPVQQTPGASDAYQVNYYLDATGRPQNTFAFDDKLTISRAQAMAEASDVAPGGRVLDYGCGLGALAIAFNRLGYDVVGVDPSPHAIEHALPEAKQFVRPLGRQVLAELEKEGPFDLVVAKDVFEHIDQGELHDVADQLLCLGRQILAIIPLVGEDRKFLFPLYEKDPTHITRLTRDEWLGFFPYTLVEDCRELTPKVRRSDKVDSTLCLRLAEPDSWRQQQYIEWARPSYRTSSWNLRQLFRRPLPRAS